MKKKKPLVCLICTELFGLKSRIFYTTDENFKYVPNLENFISKSDISEEPNIKRVIGELSSITETAMDELPLRALLGSMNFKKPRKLIFIQTRCHLKTQHKSVSTVEFRRFSNAACRFPVEYHM